MARQPPPPAGVAGGPRVSSRAIKPPSRLVEAPEDLRLARAGVSGSGGGGTGAGPGTASRQGGGTKRDAGSSQPKPRSRARVHGGGGGSSHPSAGGGMYASAGYLGGEHAGLFNMNRPFAAPFRGAPPLNPLAAPSWSVPPMSAPSARDAASALDAVSSRWSRAAGGAGAGAGAGVGVGVGAGALPAAAAAAGGGFPSGGNGPSTNGFLWEPITVQDASGAPQTLFEGPTVEDGHGADMPLPPTLDLFDLFAM